MKNIPSLNIFAVTVFLLASFSLCVGTVSAAEGDIRIIYPKEGTRGEDVVEVSAEIKRPGTVVLSTLNLSEPGEEGRVYGYFDEPGVVTLGSVRLTLDATYSISMSLYDGIIGNDPNALVKNFIDGDTLETYLPVVDESAESVVITSHGATESGPADFTLKFVTKIDGIIRIEKNELAMKEGWAQLGNFEYDFQLGDGTHKIDVYVIDPVTEKALGSDSVLYKVSSGESSISQSDSLSIALAEDPNNSATITAQVLKPLQQNSIDLSAFEYRWNFGDGTTSTTNIPLATHTYTTSGTYDVAVEMEHESDGSNYVLTRTIDVVVPPMETGDGNEQNGFPPSTSTEPTNLVPTEPLVPCGFTVNGEIPDPCGFADFLELVDNVLAFLMGFAVVMATIGFIYAGFLYVTNNGNTGRIEKAHTVFKNIFIGLLIVVSAWLLVNSIVDFLLSEAYKQALEEVRNAPDVN